MILVTGGTGFVGRHLVQQLATEGSAVRVLTRRPDSRVLPSGVEAVAGDLADPNALAAAVLGARMVVHLAAALPGEPLQESEFERVNAAGTAALAGAARNAGVIRFVHVSSAGVYGEGNAPRPHREDDPPRPLTAYQRSKLSGEAALREVLAGSTASWVILRPTDIFGPGSPSTCDFFRRVQRKRIWIHGPCHAVLQPVYVHDVVAAIMAAIQRGRLTEEITNVGGPTALDNRDWIDLVGAAQGIRPWQVRLPATAASPARTITRFITRTGLKSPLRWERFGRAMATRAVDCSRAKRLLDYRPTALERAVRETTEDLRLKGLL